MSALNAKVRVRETPHGAAFRKWASSLAMEPYTPPPPEVKSRMLTYDERTERVIPVFPDDRERLLRADPARTVNGHPLAVVAGGRGQLRST